MRVGFLSVLLVVWFCLTQAALASGEPAQDQPASDPAHSEALQASTPPAPRATRYPRIDAAVGITAVNLQKLPENSRVGGWPAGFVASAGYFWTPYLVTEVEIVSQIGDWEADYGLGHLVRPVVGGSVLERVSLTHHYVGGRRTVAQIVQIGRKFIRPYFGAGVGISGQTIRDSRQESSEPKPLGYTLPPGVKTVGELPTMLSRPLRTHSEIAFAEAGVKVFKGRRAHFLVDWKFTNTDRALKLGFGVELF